MLGIAIGERGGIMIITGIIFAAVFMGLNNDIFVKMSNCENGKGILFFVE